jgi:hypothetical protein
MTPRLKEIFDRVQNWPAEAQEELAELALEIEAGRSGVYHATPEELAAIDEADRSGVATPAEVAAAFTRFRGA